MNHLHSKRKLCSGHPDHCFSPLEKNVDSPIILDAATPAPDRNEDDCVSDSQGNYGEINGSSSHTVGYQYQVETTESLDAVKLNVSVLQDAEKAISDRMVQSFFWEQCSSPVMDIFGTSESQQERNFQIYGPQQPLQSVQQLRVASPFVGEGGGGGVRRLLHSVKLQRQPERSLKTEDQQQLKGLSADPIDQVFEGYMGACPFPTADGPCFVVDGGLTFFGDGAPSENQLLWVDERVHDELQQYMNSGALERELQIEHPDIVAIRYIAPGTPLAPDPTNPSAGVDGNTGDKVIGNNQKGILSAVLIGVGALLAACVIIYMACIRRQREREQEERNAAVGGAFPNTVSAQDVKQFQHATRSSGNSRSSTTRGLRSQSNSIYAEISRRYSDSAEDMLVNRNMAQGDTQDPLLVFDDDLSQREDDAMDASTSWRDQIIGNGNIHSKSLDPDRPFLRPVMNEEKLNDVSTDYSHFQSAVSDGHQSSFYSAISNDYPSSHDAESSHYSGSRSGGSRRSKTSRSSRRSKKSSSTRPSPSKLTVAFDRGEVV